ncbi:MAG: response regulator [Spirochaetales bacterium]|nr:response regulator [Spirochaetales bacterium]
MPVKRKRCVIVEDKTLEANSMRQWLESQGHQVVQTFNNGKAFRDWYAEHEIDLLILDIIMPVQDGFSTFFDLLNEGRLPATIFVSVENSAAIVKALKDAGAADFISKPLSRDVFLEHVKKAIDK